MVTELDPHNGIVWASEQASNAILLHEYKFITVDFKWPTMPKASDYKFFPASGNIEIK